MLLIKVSVIDDILFSVFILECSCLMSDVPMSSSHPLDSASFLSFTTFAWMTPMMWRIFRNRQDDASLCLSPHDAAETSSERSESIGVSRFKLGKGFLSVNLTHVCCFAGSTDSGRKKWQRWARRTPLWFEWSFASKEPGWFFLALLVF